MLSRLSPDWTLANSRDFNAEMRFYIDPRGIEYPVYSGTPAYSAVSGTYNKPGSYVLTSALTYLFIPGSSISGEVMVENTTGGTVESYLIRLLGGYTLTLKHSTGGGYSLSAVGSTTKTITGGVTQPLQRVGFALTYGGSLKLYVDGVNVASDTAPALNLNPTKLEINGSANSNISYCRIFDGYAATDADFASNWDHVGNEEIFFSFNKTAYGRTRCNINRSGNHLVTGYQIERSTGYKAATASLSLNNLTGEFSDDQYAAFAPEAGSYNGTSSQRFLTRSVGLEMETWAPIQAPLYPSTTLYPSNTLYPSGIMYTFEPVFRGTIPAGGFGRSTRAGGLSTVSLSAEDGIATIARRIVRKSRFWENYYLSRATPASDSVFHSIAELATKRETYNYLTNSSFENATISSSWGTDGTFVRDTTAVIDGAYCGKFSGTGKMFWQGVDFADLSAGETFTASIWVYSTGALSGTLALDENVGGLTTSTLTHAGKGWQRFTVTHTISSSASSRITLSLSGTGTWTNVPVDCAMLKYGDDYPHWVLNSNNGTGSISAVGSEIAGSYDWVGIDADDVLYVHPWAWIQQDEKVWDRMKDIADSCIARLMAIDSSGVLRFNSTFASSAPPSSGSISGMRSIGAGQQNILANSITVKGCNIIKRDNIECVWQAKASGLASDAGTTSGEFIRLVADHGTIPDETSDGRTEIEAKYGTIKDKTAVK